MNWEDEYKNAPHAVGLGPLLDASLGVILAHFATQPSRAAQISFAEQILGLTLKQLQLALPPNSKKRYGALLTSLTEVVRSDAKALLARDPAARSFDEVVLAYPGFYATAVYRIAHSLHKINMPLLPRLMTEFAHHRTGIDIHPGAIIGSEFCIDHGTGVVVGETSVVGRRVMLYQGVTLGALSVSKKPAQKKRHPTIEDDVVIYANATVLGGSTTVGHHSVIGGSVWLTESVPPHSKVFNAAAISVNAGLSKAVSPRKKKR